jgi:type IV pilus assembly protein PilM
VAAKPGAGPKAVRAAKPSGGAFVGLDIGSQTIKVVEARGVGGNLQITGIGIENTPPGAIQGGVIADPKALGTTIRALLGKSGVGAKRTVSAAAGAASVVVRVIEVPRMSQSELAETMKWEVERHIPFAANDVEMDYQAVDDGGGASGAGADGAAGFESPNMEVLLAVAQRDMVATHIETLQSAGLNPVAIDVEPLAAGRAVINLNRSDLADKNVVVVNIGATTTDVGVFKSSILRFPRTIPIAGDNFTRAISEHLGLSMEQAEDEKRANATIFMDLVVSTSGMSDFGSAAEEEGGALYNPPGGSPFDVPLNSPFAQPGAPPPSPFDLADGPGTAPPPTPSPFADNPFAASTPPPADNPFATPPADSPFESAAPVALPFDALPPSDAAPPVPIPDDPRARRQREVFDAILPILGEFGGELRRSIDYFRSRYPNDTVDQIILCGGSARIPNLDQFVQSDLGIPTVVANPFASVKVAAKQMSTERLTEIAPAFAVAVGLATRDALLGSDQK